MKNPIDFEALALELDATNRPLEAAWAYEVAVSSYKGNVDLLLNLAVLYFQSADFGYATAHHLPQEFTNASLIRAFEVLVIAKDRFGQNTEVEFWKSYFSSVYLEDEGIEDRCRELLDRNDSLLPSIYLLISGENQHANAARQLLETVKNGNTERERYIKSVIEAALTRLDP